MKCIQMQNFLPCSFREVIPVLAPVLEGRVTQSRDRVTDAHVSSVAQTQLLPLPACNEDGYHHNDWHAMYLLGAHLPDQKLVRVSVLFCR